jgi:hypothetical protein
MEVPFLGFPECQRSGFFLSPQIAVFFIRPQLRFIAI